MKDYFPLSLPIGTIGFYQKEAVQYAINSIWYINTLKKKYIKPYKNLIHRLEVYTNAITILSNGFLPIRLLLPTRLHEMS